MGNRILVTRSSMPPMEEYFEEVAPLWDSHWLTNMGVEHKKLEADLKERLGIDNLALFTNGHNALECILEAMALPTGGEVITTPFNVCNVVFDYKDCELDPTNVPYPVSRLADNMGKVLTSMLEDRPRSEQADSVRKLCDHIELEKTRLLHYTEQMKMMCSFEERSTQLDEQIKEQQEKTESEIKRLEDDSLKRIEEEKREAQRENVSVLGVFTGIVVAFVAGLTFSSSILQSIDRASIYRLCAMATVIGVFLFDTIAILLSFLGKVTRVECPDLAKIVKIANFIALVFLAAAVFARFFIPMPAYN